MLDFDDDLNVLFCEVVYYFIFILEFVVIQP